ncbi:MAG: flagellar export protein FliJ [Lachnospiraceae bacterium]|nr:flagellar export protein FliJ [Lachnospiraceae bacterium]
MGRFRYRMQNILNIKEKLESQAKNEFAAANMELLEEQDRLAKMLEHNRELEEESKRLRLRDSLSIRDIKDNRLSVELQKEKMKQQALRIHAAEKKVEQKRKAMVDLMQERKTHELLKEKAFEQFLMDEKAEESKQIDQLTSYTYGQK